VISAVVTTQAAPPVGKRVANLRVVVTGKFALDQPEPSKA